MAVLPPKVQTYHCICTSLLLATTHLLSALPHRSNSNTNSTSPTSSADIILPLPSNLPETSPENENGDELPAEGYSILLGMEKDPKTTIVRREDGFEKRVCWRCGRCRLVVGYELEGHGLGRGNGMDDGGKGKGRDGEYEGKVLYLLPWGIVGTDAMMGRSGKKIGEGDVGVRRGGVGVFE